MGNAFVDSAVTSKLYFSLATNVIYERKNIYQINRQDELKLSNDFYSDSFCDEAKSSDSDPAHRTEFFHVDSGPMSILFPVENSAADGNFTANSDFGDEKCGVREDTFPDLSRSQCYKIF
jgi:hypothetical protein